MLKHVDILSKLEKVMEHNTRFYKSDFQFDRELILKAAEQPGQGLLWLSRPCGTECFYERDVYLVGSYPYHAWLYHAESGESCIGYAVEVTGMQDGRPVGNLFKLDLRRHAADVRREAISAQVLHPEDTPTLDAILRNAHYQRRRNLHESQHKTHDPHGAHV